tara:strand:- start:4862 stop:5971 length:1110 start_codon:yes stop_codon:yes gene_type:complete
MGNGFGAALKSIAGGMATGAGVAMREERLAKYAQDKVDAQNRFTASEGLLNRNASRANADADRDSRMGLKKEEGRQRLELQLADIESKYELVKLKGVEARKTQGGDIDGKLEIQEAGLAGQLKQLREKLGVQVDIADQADSTKRYAIDTGSDDKDKALNAKVSMTADALASAEKIAGMKITGQKEITNLNINATDKRQQDQIAATALNLKTKIDSDIVALDKKLSEAKRSQKSGDYGKLERLREELKSRAELLDEKIGSSEWMQSLMIEHQEKESKKKLDVTVSEGGKNREQKEREGQRQAVTGLQTSVYSDPAAAKAGEKMLVGRGLLKAGPKPVPTDAHIKALSENPNQKAAFIAKFGQKAFNAIGK